MRSCPSEPGDASWRLRELTACWDQAYEALMRGDLARVEALLGLADEHLAALPAAVTLPADLAVLRSAEEANGRLLAGMRAGLDGLAAELAVVRRGQRALQGYSDPALGLGGSVESRV